ncbi:Haloacid dehalogenase-like hydrolase domain-containing 5 [Coccomyxa sp. Obi]|nr:Haloacid dehalogenase-like hydrolase domain-containing 5 [Coccomyxa sp. Obi]
MQRLYPHQGQTQKYPICFLTNGGGVTEAQKAQQLSDWLGVRIGEHQVVLSHTPFRSLAKSLGSKPVLVAGVGQVVHVAREYGFKHILTTADIAHAMPKAVPFWKDSSGQGPPAPGECPVMNLGLGSPKRPIEAILVFKDPGDWYLDLQIMTDVILGGGVLGRWKCPGEGDRVTVPVYFSNPDLLWATDYPAPRFGQGAFAAALRELYHQTTGKELEHHYYGKPNRAPYALAEELLLAQAVTLGQVPASSGAWTAKSGAASAFGAIYAVGDNPKADIAGANAQGRPWVSMLVRTGVFTGGEGQNDREHPADVVVDDVADAVEAALHRTRSSEWHSLR